jgi:hypothetical protein
VIRGRLLIGFSLASNGEHRARCVAGDLLSHTPEQQVAQTSCPWVPITMRSTASSRATRKISSAGLPTPTLLSCGMGALRCFWAKSYSSVKALSTRSMMIGWPAKGRWIDYHSTVTGMAFCLASSVFGRLIVSTPFLKLGLIWSWATGAGSRTIRTNAP